VRSGRSASRVTEAIAARRTDIANLASELIGFDTTARLPGDAPRQEAELQEHLASRLAAAGCEVRVWEPERGAVEQWRSQVGSDVDFEGRPQLLARWPGTGKGRSLLLNGHIDVVSAEPCERWTGDPFVARIEGDRITGRGACDMKGGIAAMIVAAETVIEEAGRLPGDLGVNTVTDEESTGAGALAAIASGVRADAVIVPEPTSFDVWVGCRGSLTPTIRVRGRPGHAELPQPPWEEGGAVNAIEKLAPILVAVERLRQHWQTSPEQQHQHLAPGTIVPVLISGGEWFVTYPGRAELTCELMYLPTTADANGGGSLVARELEGWLKDAIEADDWLRRNPPRIDWGSDIPPCQIPDDHPLAQVMIDATTALDLPSTITGFNSWYDGASFVRSGSPAIAFGPPRTEDAHTVDESVDVDDLVRCAQAMAVAILEWCR
jgi:acetylornithine deacetylase